MYIFIHKKNRTNTAACPEGYETPCNDDPIDADPISTLPQLIAGTLTNTALDIGEVRYYEVDLSEYHQEIHDNTHSHLVSVTHFQKTAFFFIYL